MKGRVRVVRRRWRGVVCHDGVLVGIVVMVWVECTRRKGTSFR